MKNKETITRYMTKHFRTLLVLAVALLPVVAVQAQEGQEELLHVQGQEGRL